MSLLDKKRDELKQIEERLAELEKKYQDEVKPLKEKLEKLWCVVKALEEQEKEFQYRLEAEQAMLEENNKNQREAFREIANKITEQGVDDDTIAALEGFAVDFLGIAGQVDDTGKPDNPESAQSAA